MSGNAKTSENELIRFIEWGLKKRVFSIGEFLDYFKPTPEFVEYFDHIKSLNNGMPIVVRISRHPYEKVHERNDKYMISPDAQFAVYDHYEMINAKETAKQANMIAISSLLFGILMSPLLFLWQNLIIPTPNVAKWQVMGVFSMSMMSVFLIIAVIMFFFNNKDLEIIIERKFQVPIVNLALLCAIFFAALAAISILIYR
jgi:hypothetical protein